MWLCVCLYVYVCYRKIWIRICICVFVNVCMCVCVFTYVYVYVCVCVCVCEHKILSEIGKGDVADAILSHWHCVLIHPWWGMWTTKYLQYNITRCLFNCFLYYCIDVCMGTVCCFIQISQKAKPMVPGVVFRQANTCEQLNYIFPPTSRLNI